MFEAVQRQVVLVFADHDPGQQPDRGHAAVDHGRRNRCRRDGFAGAAGILRADVAVDKEFGRLDIQLFGDVFADFDQAVAAVAAGAGRRLMAVFDARQVVRQGLASGAGAFGFGVCAAGLELPHFRFDGGKVGVQGFLEHVALQRRQGFAFDAKADAPDKGELVCQGFDFEVFGADGSVFGLDGFGVALNLAQQCLDHRRHLVFGAGA